jgi:hypothetical protein
VTFNITEKMPYELRIFKLPISYHYYDPVPIMMAKYIGAQEIKEREMRLRKLISFKNPTKEDQRHMIFGFLNCFESKKSKETVLAEEHAKIIQLEIMKKAGTFDQWSKEKVELFFQQVHFLARDTDEEIDFLKLQNKTLYMKQLMNLKTRGRYFDETNTFIAEVKHAPSLRSQKIVVSNDSL